MTAQRNDRRERRILSLDELSAEVAADREAERHAEKIGPDPIRVARDAARRERYGTGRAEPGRPRRSRPGSGES